MESKACPIVPGVSEWKWKPIDWITPWSRYRNLIAEARVIESDHQCRGNGRWSFFALLPLPPLPSWLNLKIPVQMILPSAILRVRCVGYFCARILTSRGWRGAEEYGSTASGRNNLYPAHLYPGHNFGCQVLLVSLTKPFLVASYLSIDREYPVFFCHSNS